MGISRINNNLSAQSIRVLNNQIAPQLQQNLERLASGLRLNRAGDDAAGLSIANRLLSQIRGVSEAFDAAQSGINLINVGDQALGSITDRLGRIRELTVQAGNTGVNDQQATQAIQAEITQNIDEINRIADTTQFGGNRLFSGEDGQANFQVGANPGQQLSVSFGNVRTDALGLGEGQSVADIDVTREGGVDEVLRVIDVALVQVNSIRSQLGAASNRLESTANSLAVAAENLIASRSRIADADIAREVTNRTLNELMVRANLSVQSQAINLQNILFTNLLR